ncbi:MAG TPA: bifunctional phosphoribosylaminoimidazolecarboxamide formyltransferase/IMP cyclohydrolase [Candidatus Thermoplasmatota archaeon]|nr:bifunctional phosphoribosylaminoimidazolecarboxamide formyltransferase/IMP cyclohydrolase [Candidatus Thermoplasmatota archaeon]HVL49034.1 bifunctional phosphoribosylaminoimidazolecarboxamide formyltransferase/IMP cyclohydrolase [Candidatus Thermoplasmatota archaeon]
MGFTALVSVSDKTGLIDFSRRLAKCGADFVSTGGTARVLRESGLPVRDVSTVTGFPEMLEGRVKTMHPRVHAGILALREKEDHMSALARHDIHPIDLVVVNLYKFEEAVAKGLPLERVLEEIDIGGPSLVRAAAKNFPHVTVVTDPTQYERVAAAYESGSVDFALRQRLAAEAFAHTARYDTIIDQYFRHHVLSDDFPPSLNLSFTKVQDLRYGENSHQAAAFYAGKPTQEPSIVNGKQLHGKELSYNNIVDADTALEAVKDFDRPSCVIIKHATPCGMASAATASDAFRLAFACDTYSPFGGVIAFNREVDEETAEAIGDLFLEVIVAPSFSAAALERLMRKKNLRLVEVRGLQTRGRWGGLQYRSVVGGLVVQERDILEPNIKNWKVVTRREPTSMELRSMLFAFKAVRHVRSNSVVFVKEEHTVAIGGGQTARVDATRIAVQKGGDRIRGSVMASDAFFPFRDGVDEAAAAGVAAIVQPGGSIRDDEVIKSADEHGLAMVFTGQRCFRH